MVPTKKKKRMCNYAPRKKVGKKYTMETSFFALEKEGKYLEGPPPPPSSRKKSLLRILIIASFFLFLAKRVSGRYFGLAAAENCCTT